MKFVATAFLALLLARDGVAAELTVIDLRNRTATELMPVLQPLVPQATLTGMDYKLFVRGSDDDLARVREALAVLDRAPRQLLVSVRYAAMPSQRQDTLGVSGTVSNRGAQIVVGGQTTTRTASDANVSSVRVLEGNAAHIATGQSIPVVTAMLITPRAAAQELGYRDLASGFTVLPRVSDTRVILEITTQQERAVDSSGNVGVQRAATTLTGALDQWIELGHIGESGQSKQTVLGVGAVSSTTTASDQRSFAVKVTVVEQ